jgi:hypothetical protein
MRLIVTCSICTCLCLIFASYAVSGIAWHSLVVSIFINTLYIIENLALFERARSLEADTQLKSSTIDRIRTFCRDLFIQNSELERKLRRASLQSNSEDNIIINKNAKNPKLETSKQRRSSSSSSLEA